MTCEVLRSTEISGGNIPLGHMTSVSSVVVMNQVHDRHRVLGGDGSDRLTATSCQDGNGTVMAMTTQQ